MAPGQRSFTQRHFPERRDKKHVWTSSSPAASSSSGSCKMANLWLLAKPAICCEVFFFLKSAKLLEPARGRNVFPSPQERRWTWNGSKCIEAISSLTALWERPRRVQAFMLLHLRTTDREHISRPSPGLLSITSRKAACWRGGFRPRQHQRGRRLSSPTVPLHKPQNRFRTLLWHSRSWQQAYEDRRGKIQAYVETFLDVEMWKAST